MDKKDKDLLELRSYIDGVDKEVTMLLQSLQWDRKHLLEGSTLVSCRYDATHKVPPDKQEFHEKECFLRCEGYTKKDVFLPDPLDPGAPTVVKLRRQDIQQIINNAAQADPSFQKGVGRPGFCEPLTAGRLQASYSADERRAIHDAVVSTAPDFEHVENIDLVSAEVKEERRRKSKLEVLAELRDMRRRRAKYRGANAASKNYSNVLRDFIKTQMEIYTGISADSVPQHTRHDKNVRIKQEPISDEENGHTQEQKRERHTQRNDRDRHSSREQENYRLNRNDRSHRDITDRSHRDNTDRSHRDNTDRSHRDNTDRSHRDNTDRSHRGTIERHKYRQESDRHRHARTYGKLRDDVHIKEEPTSNGDNDRRETHKERESRSHQEYKEKHRHKNRHNEPQRYSNTNERHSYGSDSQREESTDKYSKDYYNNRNSKYKDRKEFSEDRSNRDTQTSRKSKHSDDYDSREPRHNKSKHRRDRS